jgi:2-phosphosulfolactate phosphatase
MKTVEVLFTPADFATLAHRDLRETVCVVIDVLRATSTIVTALAHGADAVIPVPEISAALAWRAQQPDVLLAGERDGLRIRAAQTGGVDFDFGNSPREFTAAKVRGKTIVTTTTNGTRALHACDGARAVLAASFLNLTATVVQLGRLAPENLLLVCSGTGNQAALEDTLCAGALCHQLGHAAEAALADSAIIAREIFRAAQSDLLAAASRSANARRLLANPDLRDDVAFCLREDVFAVVAEQGRDGAVRAAQLSGGGGF